MHTLTGRAVCMLPRALGATEQAFCSQHPALPLRSCSLLPLLPLLRPLCCQALGPHCSELSVSAHQGHTHCLPLSLAAGLSRPGLAQHLPMLLIH